VRVGVKYICTRTLFKYKQSIAACSQPHRYGDSHAIKGGHRVLPATRQRWHCQPLPLLDLATPEGCKAELSGYKPRWHMLLLQNVPPDVTSVSTTLTASERVSRRAAKAATSTHSTSSVSVSRSCVVLVNSYSSRRAAIPDMELGHWVTGSMGHLGHLLRPGHRVIIWPGVRPEFFPVFEKKPKKKDIKICIVVNIHPTVIEILTFNKWSSKFYFPERANAKQR